MELYNGKPCEIQGFKVEAGQGFPAEVPYPVICSTIEFVKQKKYLASEVDCEIYTQSKPREGWCTPPSGVHLYHGSNLFKKLKELSEKDWLETITVRHITWRIPKFMIRYIPETDTLLFWCMSV